MSVHYCRAAVCFHGKLGHLKFPRVIKSKFLLIIQAGDENKVTHQGVNVLMYHQFLVTNIKSDVQQSVRKTDILNFAINWFQHLETSDWQLSHTNKISLAV